MGANKRLKSTTLLEYNQVKEVKTVMDKHYKFTYANFKLMKKRLLDMKIERERLKPFEGFL